MKKSILIPILALILCAGLLFGVTMATSGMYLENSRACVVHEVAKSQTHLSNFLFLSFSPKLPSYIIFHEVFLLPPSS